MWGPPLGVAAATTCPYSQLGAGRGMAAAVAALVLFSKLAGATVMLLLSLLPGPTGRTAASAILPPAAVAASGALASGSAMSTAPLPAGSMSRKLQVAARCPQEANEWRTRHSKCQPNSKLLSCCADLAAIAGLTAPLLTAGSQEALPVETWRRALASLPFLYRCPALQLQLPRLGSTEPG